MPTGAAALWWQSPSTTGTATGLHASHHGLDHSLTAKVGDCTPWYVKKEQATCYMVPSARGIQRLVKPSSLPKSPSETALADRGYLKPVKSDVKYLKTLLAASRPPPRATDGVLSQRTDRSNLSSSRDEVGPLARVRSMPHMAAVHPKDPRDLKWNPRVHHVNNQDSRNRILGLPSER